MSDQRSMLNLDGSPRPPSALLRWLNGDVDAEYAYQGKPTKASRASVLNLFRQLVEVSAELAAFDRENPNYDFFDFPPKKISAHIDRIQTLLNDYVQAPYLEIIYRGDNAALDVNQTFEARKPMGEQLAVWDMVRLVQAGRLEAVRQCGCDRWFFAKRADQKACSPGCRHKTYEQTDAFKAKRRAYMREYYMLKQSGKVK